VCGGDGPNRCGSRPVSPGLAPISEPSAGPPRIAAAKSSRLREPVRAAEELRRRGVANKCGCKPVTCAMQGKNCGMIPDGCGGMLDCGSTCAAPSSCGGAAGERLRVQAKVASTSVPSAALPATGAAATSTAVRVPHRDVRRQRHAEQVRVRADDLRGQGVPTAALTPDGCGGMLDCGMCMGTDVCGAEVQTSAARECARRRLVRRSASTAVRHRTAAARRSIAGCARPRRRAAAPAPRITAGASLRRATPRVRGAAPLTTLRGRGDLPSLRAQSRLRGQPVRQDLS
jgi:hypothetical protein